MIMKTSQGWRRDPYYIGVIRAAASAGCGASFATLKHTITHPRKVEPADTAVSRVVHTPSNSQSTHHLTLVHFNSCW